MLRFWVSWWTRKYLTSHRTARQAPFQYWLTGETLEEPPRYSLCALIDADSESAMRRKVSKIFDDADFRFCDEKPATWSPSGGRFPPY